MDYSENKEQIIKDNLKWADKAIIEEFLSTDAYKVWISMPFVTLLKNG